MSNETINFLPYSERLRFAEIAKQRGFSEPTELLRELALDYLEMKRIEALVVEGLNDPDVTELTDNDFVEMKAELEEYIESNEKQPVS